MPTRESSAAAGQGRPDTRELIFEHAERLFAAHGFGGVSVRAISAAAQVNLAAVGYHYGSKDGLLFEIFRRRAAELSRERVRLLHETEAAAGGLPGLRAILHALLYPPLRWHRPDSGRQVSARFLLRALTEATAQMQAYMQTETSHLQRFVPALARALPTLALDELCWRLHFTLGILHYAGIDMPRLVALSGGMVEPLDLDGKLQRMLDFAEAGFLRPPAQVLADRSVTAPPGSATPR